LQQVLDFFRSGFGFPRFKGQHRFDSFTYPQSGFSLDSQQLSLSNIGNVKVRLSRELPADAVVKNLHHQAHSFRMVCNLGIRVYPLPLPASDLAVGIDVGVTTFSDGGEIQNPRIYQNAQAELRRA
jgi:putative transposase